MRSMRSAVAIISTGAMCCASASTAAPRQPTGPWHVDYDTAQCVGMRDYGTPEQPLTLALKPSPNGGVMRLLVIRKGTSAVEQAPVSVRLGDKQLKTSLLLYSNDKNHFRVASINLPMADFKAHLDANEIGLTGGVSESFAVPGLSAVTAELEKCVVDLQDYWNIGASRAGKIASEARPKRPLWQLYSAGDYPSVALYRGQSGAARIVFLVDERGAVSDCSVDVTSGISSLDTMSCYVLQQRAKFDPALGPDGKPARSAYCERIVWKANPGEKVPRDDDSTAESRCPEDPWDKKR